mgnify:CR=1 FL=1
MTHAFKTFKNQRGAMFGLDARIAMAIFATISIVVGYFGMGKITTANNAAFLKQLQAYEDAIMQIQTDLGVFYQFAIDGSDGIKDFNAIDTETGNILARYQPRWNGPYIDGIRRDHPIYGSFTVAYQQADYTTACNINNDCFVWLVLDGVPASVFDYVNRHVDEDSGLDSEGTPISEGRVRADGATDPRELRFRTNAVRRAG